MATTLTVTALCYQERPFIRAWLENMLQFADKILLSEGGSTDGTLEIINEYQVRYPGRIEVFPYNQSKTPQKDEYDEGLRRNLLLSKVSEGYVVVVDIDELLPDNFRSCIEQYLSPDLTILGKWLNFWRGPRMIRVGAPDDPHWGPIARPLVYPANKVQFNEAKIHSTPATCPPMLSITNLPIYHYHYLFARHKVRECRLQEWNGYGNHEIRLEQFPYPHPMAIKFLEETVCYGDLIDIL